MTRINTNVSSLIAQHHLNRTNNDLQTRLERLSTGLAINRGADDPAGLIVSERLRSEIQGVGQAIDHAERAANVIATAEAAMAEVSNLLTSIKALTVEAANTGAFSKQEIEANQLQIDSAVESITRISNTTSFAGLKLLNGSLDYITSGVATSAIADVQFFAANFGTNTTIPVTVDVLNSAETAQLFLSGGSATPTLVSSVTISVEGNKGVEVIELTSGQTFTSIVAAINQRSDSTGVSASIVNTSALVFSSTTYGSEAFVSVQELTDSPAFNTIDALGGAVRERDNGEDVLALINGGLALGDGLDVSLRSSTLNIKLGLTVAAAQTLTAGTPHTFTITGGGANYQIGPSVNTSQQVGFGIQSVAAHKLGNAVVGFLNTVVTGGANSLVAGKAAEASLVIDAAIDDISGLRGRLGAFERNTLRTTVRSSQVALENLISAESQVRDTDFASEAALLTRAQILVNAGVSTLAIANTSAQSVLALLG